MPQASDKLRDKIKTMFNDSIDNAGPTEFLEKAGYNLSVGTWTWTKPGVTELWEMTQDEFTCMCFLAEEWDYGGLAE